MDSLRFGITILAVVATPPLLSADNTGRDAKSKRDKQPSLIESALKANFNSGCRHHEIGGSPSNGRHPLSHDSHLLPNLFPYRLTKRGLNTRVASALAYYFRSCHIRATPPTGRARFYRYPTSIFVNNCTSWTVVKSPVPLAVVPTRLEYDLLVQSGFRGSSNFHHT